MFISACARCAPHCTLCHSNMDSYSSLWLMYTDHGFVHAVTLAVVDGQPKYVLSSMCVLSSMSDECLHMRQVLMQSWRPVEPGNPQERVLYEESPWHGDWSCCIYFSFCDHFMSFVFCRRIYNFGGRQWVHVRMNWQGREASLFVSFVEPFLIIRMSS